MRLKLLGWLGFVFLLFLLLVPSSLTAAGSNYVILIPGLLRSPKTMEPMAKALRAEGYETLIVDYPSREMGIRALADGFVAPAVRRCQKKGAGEILFVTHSMGGILVRDFLSRHKLPELGRVVMLAPPNGGSEVVDQLGDWEAFKWINGPAGGELGTGQKSKPKVLGALGVVTYSVGIIAGDRSINPINSMMIPGSDDGKVSVENTKLAGMTDHITLHRTHPMMMQRADAIQLTLHFLKLGTFAP